MPSRAIPHSLDVVTTIRSELAEGPVWDDARNSLWYVDLLRGLLHRQPAGDGAAEVFEFGDAASAVALRGDGSLLVAVGHGFVTFDPASGAVEPAVTIATSEPGIRLNDGKADASGRFWAGTMHSAAEAGRGSLYSLSAGWRLHRHLTGCTISNGLGWSPDNRVCYFVDTATRRVDSFPFDLTSGTLGGRRTLIDLSGHDGRPDGLAVDTAGRLWVAMAGGGRVLCVSARGAVVGTLPLPVSLVTSCAFGGHGLDELFITTGFLGLTSSALAAEPLAGAVFSARVPGTAGLPVGVFRG
jgi:sugar lactone lactonase YvrE